MRIGCEVDSFCKKRPHFPSRHLPPTTTTMTDRRRSATHHPPNSSPTHIPILRPNAMIRRARLVAGTVGSFVILCHLCGHRPAELKPSPTAAGYSSTTKPSPDPLPPPPARVRQKLIVIAFETKKKWVILTLLWLFLLHKPSFISSGNTGTSTKLHTQQPTTRPFGYMFERLVVAFLTGGTQQNTTINQLKGRFINHSFMCAACM